jgi:hypothetical protein
MLLGGLSSTDRGWHPTRHERGGPKSLVILFFETEDDYRRGDEVLNAMPAGNTPGRRTSVTRYDVAIRMTA